MKTASVKTGYEVIVNGVEYPNLLTARIRLDITEMDNTEISAIAYRRGVNAGVIVEELYNKKHGIKVESPIIPIKNIYNEDDIFLEQANKALGTNFSTVKGTLGYIRENLNSKIIEMQRYRRNPLELVVYLHECGLGNLAKRREEDGLFEYRDAFYLNTQDFFVKQGIYSNTFYMNIIAEKGDADKALEISKRYRFDKNGVVVEGRIFYNVGDLLVHLGLTNQNPIKDLIMYNLEFDVAVELYIMLDRLAKVADVTSTGYKTFQSVKNMLYRVHGISLNEELAHYYSNGNRIRTEAELLAFITGLIK